MITWRDMLPNDGDVLALIHAYASARDGTLDDVRKVEEALRVLSSVSKEVLGWYGLEEFANPTGGHAPLPPSATSRASLLIEIARRAAQIPQTPGHTPRQHIEQLFRRAGEQPPTRKQIRIALDANKRLTEGGPRDD